MTGWYSGAPRAGVPRPLLVIAVLLAGALAAWAVTIDRMRGMDAGPGTDLGALGWFVGVWVTMMAAMMLPSVAPMVLVFDRVNRDRARRGSPTEVPTWVFVAGYLVAWTVYGVVAYGLYRVVKDAARAFLAWHRGGRYVAAGAVAFAGVYQLTPLKDICLRHCRGPVHFVLGGWRDGPLGALRMGVEHGSFCIGCCWGLMVALFALGVMSIVWMVVIAGVILAEKVLPRGERLSRVFAVGLVGLGLWVAISPGSVPGLTEPPAQPMHGPSMH